MEERRSTNFWLLFTGVLIGIIFAIVFSIGILSYVTGISVKGLLLDGELKDVLKLAEGKERVVRIESKNVLDPVVAVSEKVQPSVVNIRVEKVARIENYFFGPDYERVSGIGTGIIIRKDGYIITNYHVVQGANEIIVTLLGGKEYKGKVVGRDRDTDLAVVKVETTDLPAVEIGDSSKLQVGEVAVAIGNPFGLSYTVSAGVISALRRNVSIQDETGVTRTYTNLIQTDAAINPGNSGGPLCDVEGRVIGVNSLIYSQSGGYQGIGFAIPINDAMAVAKQLIETGKVSHPFIGVLGTDAKDFSESLPEEAQVGAIILEVMAGTPAANAGLKKGDVIVEMDGKKITSMEDLIAEIRNRKVGDKVKITYFRGKEKKTAEMVLAEKPVSYTVPGSLSGNLV